MSAAIASAKVVAGGEDRVDVPRVYSEVAVEVSHERHSSCDVESVNQSRYLEAKGVTHVHRVRLTRAVRGKSAVLLVEITLPHQSPSPGLRVMIDSERRTGC